MTELTKSDTPIQQVSLWRCPECGVEGTGRWPTESGIFEPASDEFDVDKAICRECDTLLPEPDPQGRGA